MKFIKTSLAVFLVSSTLAFAGNNLDEKVKSDQKFSFSSFKTTLPREITADNATELPSKQREKTKKYTPEEKAAICELELTSLKK